MVDYVHLDRKAQTGVEDAYNNAWDSYLGKEEMNWLWITIKVKMFISNTLWTTDYQMLDIQYSNDIY